MDVNSSQPRPSAANPDLGGEADVEDTMQEAFVRAIAKLETLRDPARARAWLCQIARRTCIDRSRRVRPTQTLPEQLAAPGGQDDPRARDLREAIAALPEEQREVITLYYLDGRRCATVAEALGISEVAVRQRLVRARRALHGLLREDAT